MPITKATAARLHYNKWTLGAWSFVVRIGGIRFVSHSPVSRGLATLGGGRKAFSGINSNCHRPGQQLRRKVP